MTSDWKFGGRAGTRRDDAGRFVRPDGKRRRKAGRSGRAGSGARAMLGSEQLADCLVSLEDECQLLRRRSGKSPNAQDRTRDCTKIHGEMTKACAALGDIVRKLAEAEPEVIHQPKVRLAKLLLEESGISLRPRSLGRWPYKDAIEAAMAVDFASPGSREARVRKRQRENSDRMLHWQIEKLEEERDRLDAECADAARTFAQALEPLAD